MFDFGFERQERFFEGKHLGLGQYHDVRISRKNGGSTLVMQVCGIFMIHINWKYIVLKSVIFDMFYPTG